MCVSTVVPKDLPVLVPEPGCFLWQKGPQGGGDPGFPGGPWHPHQVLLRGRQRGGALETDRLCAAGSEDGGGVVDQGGSTSGYRTRQEQVSLGPRVTGGGGQIPALSMPGFCPGRPCWILTSRTVKSSLVWG